MAGPTPAAHTPEFRHMMTILKVAIGALEERGDPNIGALLQTVERLERLALETPVVMDTGGSAAGPSGAS